MVPDDDGSAITEWYRLALVGRGWKISALVRNCIGRVETILIECTGCVEIPGSQRVILGEKIREKFAIFSHPRLRLRGNCI